MIFLTHTPEETELLGERLSRSLSPGAVVALCGDLGAGKTAFARGLARGLGISAAVTSPTYTIVNEYDGPVPFFHFDLYRLGGPDELFDIGWDDYLSRGGICAVEWSERAGELLGDCPLCVRVTLSRGETAQERHIQIEGVDTLADSGT